MEEKKEKVKENKKEEKKEKKAINLEDIETENNNPPIKLDLIGFGSFDIPI